MNDGFGGGSPVEVFIGNGLEDGYGCGDENDGF